MLFSTKQYRQSLYDIWFPGNIDDILCSVFVLSVILRWAFFFLPYVLLIVVCINVCIEPVQLIGYRSVKLTAATGHCSNIMTSFPSAMLQLSKTPFERLRRTSVRTTVATRWSQVRQRTRSFVHTARSP
jgi:hypothetical protein